MRQAGLFAVPILLGIGGPIVIGADNLALGIAMLTVAVLWGLLLVPWVADQLPHAVVERGPLSNGVAVRLLPPKGGRRRRLKRESQALSKSIHAYLATQEAPTATSMKVHNETIAKMRLAEDEAAQDAIWRESTERITEQHARESQELSARFGGQLGYALDQYQHLGMLTPEDRIQYEWKANSLNWIKDLARDLDRLSRHL